MGALTFEDILKSSPYHDTYDLDADAEIEAVVNTWTDTDGIYSDVEKANPYHDERGRFTFAPGGSGNRRVLTYSTGAVSGQVNMRSDLMDGENVAGYVEYSVYDGVPSIQYIHTDDNYKRQGVATELMQNIQREYPDTEIGFGMTTPDGTKFLESITYEVKDEKVAAGKKKLSDMKAELDHTQKELDRLYGLEEPSESEWEQTIKYGDRWEELNDGIRVLEQDLAGKKESKRFVRLDGYNIEKKNPYHDPKTGRFTHAPGGGNPMIRTEPPPTKTKIAYKVFVVKDGKLYPPMVANPDGMDTPVGVWLNASEGKKAMNPDGTPVKNTLGREKVKAGGKGTQGGSGQLAYRPGWHLGEVPEAKQFYTKDKQTGEKKQKKNFVWAECEIAADYDYQEEAMSYGYNKNGKFQHSLAGLPKIPKDGYYTYRTNPDPTTKPWYITGAMKVNRILTDAETNKILRDHGIEPMERDGGELDLKALGLDKTDFVGKGMLFDYIVEKFNPYHDRLGRFTTAGSAMSFTYAPGKSKAHDMAIERAKERMGKIMPTDAQIKTLKGIETKTRNLKKEQFRIVDRDGNILMEKQGERDVVHLRIGDLRDNLPGNIAIHNHPGGGTFSSADLVCLGHQATEIRVAAAEGTYILRNMTKYSGKYDPKQKGWLEMRDDLDAASDKFKSSRELKAEIAKPFNEKLQPYVDKWTKLRESGASSEEIDAVAKQYMAASEASRKEIEAATRKAYVGQFHSWYRSHAGEYGMEYEFIPLKTRTRKGMPVEDHIDHIIEKGEGDLELDGKMAQDVRDIADEIMRDILGRIPDTRSVEKSAESEFTIYKADEDKRLVFGWASIALTADGEQLEDRQNDIIDPEDLEEAAYEYVLNFRDTGEEHVPTMRKKGRLVESCVLTKEKQQAMGIPEGAVPVGWWIGFYIDDDDAWERVKNGTYRMFSVEGRANREPVEKSERVAKTFDEILKFNPYHDQLGRFTTADGATSFTYKPGQGRMYDLAIERERKRTEQSSTSGRERGGAESIAGVSRGKPMTHEQADEKHSNPGYHATPDSRKLSEASNKLSEAIKRGAPDREKNQIKTEIEQARKEYNKAVEESYQYTNNCQSCVLAYEARRRGFDVEARPRTGNNPKQETLAKDQSFGYKDPTTGKKVEKISNDPKVKTAKQAQKWLDENTEEGGRYAFSHGWKGTDGRSGHVVVAEKIGGKIRICDPQDGKTYTDDGVAEYMSRIRSTYSVKYYDGAETKGRLGLVRLDTAQINEEFANAVLRGVGQ